MKLRYKNCKMKTETTLNLAFTKKVSETSYQSFLVYCGHNWGRGLTLTDAIKAAKVHPANEFNAVLFKSTKPFEVFVTESGNWIYETEQDGEIVEAIELGDIKVWFNPDNIILDLCESLASELRNKSYDDAAKFEDMSNRLIGKYFND